MLVNESAATYISTIAKSEQDITFSTRRYSCESDKIEKSIDQEEPRGKMIHPQYDVRDGPQRLSCE